MSRVAVTGAHGLLGGWLCAALLERGDEVAVLRHRGAAPGSAIAVTGVESRCRVVQGDVRDPEAVAAVLRGAQVVFHLAAQSVVGVAERDPTGTMDVNVRGTWTVLEAARAVQAEAVVVASSYRVYGDAPVPYREDGPLRGSSPYDASKRAAEALAAGWAATYGLPAATTRAANLYGGGDPNGSRLVPEAVSAALAGRSPVVRSDGSPERDFLHVEDAVAAYLGIAGALREGRGVGEAFNAGGGRAHRVLDVVTAVCRAAGTGVRPVVRGEPQPPDRQVVDVAKLHALIGWAPRIGLEEGLARTVEWHRRWA